VVTRRFLRLALGLLVSGRVVGLGVPAESAEHYMRALGILTADRGQGAPDFTLTDSAGKAHRLRDYRGKVVLLGFGATW